MKIHAIGIVKHSAMVVSAILLVAMCILFGIGFLIVPEGAYLSAGKDFQFGIKRSGRMDVRLVFFNDAVSGPYLGSTLGIVDDQGNVYPPRIRESAWGDRYGVYWRYFALGSDQAGHKAVLWTLMVSAMYPILLFSILPAAALIRYLRRPCEKVDQLDTADPRGLA